MKSYQYLLYILVLCVIGMLLGECSQPESTHLYIIPSYETPCPPKITCQTLEFVAQNPEQFFTNNCTVYFLHGIHYLPTTDFILIEQKSNLSLIGNVTFTPNVLQSGSTVQCNGQGGFRFSAIENLLIRNLRFNNCGAYHNFTVIATILLQSVTNLTISGAAVYNSTGIGLYTENVIGSSIISNSSFFFNGAFTELVGGNLRLLWSMECAHSVESPTFVIENSTFAYGQNRQGASGGIQTDLSLCEKVKVFIRHCVILANSGGAGGNLGITILDHRNWHKQKVEIIIEDTSIQHGMAETGGGIGLVLNTQDEKLVNHTTVQKYKAIISNSTFISNRAYYGGGGGGGGIFVAADFTILRLEVSNTTFLHNSALGSTGGGVSIVTKCSYFYSFEPELLELLFSDSVFANNTATHGGGLNIRSEHSYVLDCVKSHFTTVIQDTTFTDNAATYSSSAMSFSISSIQTPNYLVMKNVHFHRNRINATISAFAHEHSDSSGGFATVSIVNSPNVTITNCSYLENLGTALVTVGSNILFTGNNSFTNNTGNRGGGMAMSSSYMLLSCHSHLWFQNNRAHWGGGIYIQEQELLSFNEPCFYVPTYLSNGTVSEPSVKHLYFEGNTAQYAGDVLYGGRIDTCTMHSSHNNQLTGTSFDTLSSLASQVGDSVVASNPDMICLCINNEPKCENRSMSIEIVSGKSFTLSLVATGQKFGIAPSEIYSTILSKVQTNNFLQQSIHQLESSCTNVTFTLYSVSAVETIALSVENTLSLGKANLITSKSLLIEATLSPCPMGFVLSGEPPRCNCAPALLEHQLRCDVLNWTIQQKGRTWIGFYEENASGILLHDHCPFDYCKETQMWINISSADQQCSFNRTGILCGKCKEGLSLVLGSSRCLQCSNSYLLLVLVFALAGVLLVFAIRISNLTVSFGKISSLIFYANIIQINRLLFLPEDTNVLTVFIAWLNLDFGIVTCFYNGMDSFAKMLLQFVFPSYLCIIAGAIIIASRYSRKLSRLFGNRSVAVIATLILIADAKLLRSAITILSVTSLKYPDSSISTLWLYDGNIGYWDIRHISLIIIACCIILLHFVLLSLLLFIQCLQRSSHLTCLSWIWKLKPYFDAYTAPHKNRYRFWTGLLLLLRIILFVFSLFSPTFSLFAIVLGGCCLLMLGWCFGGVHKHNVLNILEPFILLNLVFIAVFTIYAQSSGSQWIRIAMVYTSVGTVFILFLTITIYEIVSSNPWIKRWVCRLRQCISHCKCCWHHQRELSTIGSPVPQSSHLLKPLTLTFDKDSEAVLIEENNSQTRIQRVIMDEDGELTLMVEDCESQSGMSTWRQTDSDEPTLVEDQSIQATSSTQRVTEETLVEFIHATIQQPTLFEDSCESDVDSSVDGLKQSYTEGTEMDQGKRLSLIESDISNEVLNTSLVAANEHHPFTHMRPLTPTLYNHKEASVLSKVHEPGFGDVLEVQHSILQQQSAATSTDSGLTHTSSELTQTSSELNLQLPLAVPYLDPIEVVTFDHSGGEYTNKAHNIIIRVPRGAIPKGVKVDIEVGVTLHGPFSFPQNTKPVSPIVWLCMQQDVHLRKPVEVVLPHCICGLKEGEHDDLELRFLKANHHDVVGSEGQSAYNFLPLEGEATFTPSCGTVHTQHFCFQCISAKKSREVVQRSGYCLTRVIPHPWPAAQSQIFIYFCVTYLMETCLEMIERQYSTGFRFERREFYFASAGDNKLCISIERDIPKGWFAILEDIEMIEAHEVDFWDRDPEQLELMEKRRMYPPRFTVCVTGSSATGPSSLQVKFAGSQQKLNTEIMLPYVRREGLNYSRLTNTLWKNEDVGVGLHYAPSDQDLMNYVVAKIPTKWKEVGVQLGLAHECLEQTEAENRNQHYCFFDILNKWKKNASPPYTWATLIDALLQPSVNEKLLAQTLREIFC